MKSSRLSGGFRIVAIVAVIVVLAAAGGCYVLDRNQAADHALTASGTIETRVVNLSSDLNGRVLQVLAEEGQSVKAGQALAKLDDATLQTQLAQAKAALQTAQANYDLLAAGPTAEQLRQAQAALDAAQAKLDAIKAGPRPETVAQAEANLAAAQAKLDQVKKGATDQDIALARLAVEQAKDALWAAQSSRDGICGNKMAPSYQCTAAQAQVAAAETGVQQAETRLAQLQAGSTPEVISQTEEAVRIAQAQLALAKQPYTSYDEKAAAAQVELAQSQLDALKAGTRAQQLAAAQGQVDTAKAQVQAIQLQLNKVTVTAPIDGVILSRSIEPGEMAMAGATLFQIGQLNSLEVTVYLPEEEFARVTPGEQASVHVDAYPNRTFTATVLRVADQAEFTPRNVQTTEGRKDTVFAVRLSIANPDLALKPGTPADVTFAQK